MALIPPVMYNAQIYSIPLSRQTYVSSICLPFPSAAKKEKRKTEEGRERVKKNVQGRTLTSAACNIPYGRSSVIFSGKSVAAAFSLYRIEAGPDSGFSTEGRKGGREECGGMWMSSRWGEKTTKAVVKTAKRGVETVAKVEGSRGSVITYEIQAFPV